MEGTSGGGPKPPRTLQEIVRSRGVAILMQLAMPVLHDRGGDSGRATKCRISDIQDHPDGRVVFVLDIPEKNERGRLIGMKRLHLSALQILFSAAIRDTFPTEDRAGVKVMVGILDPERNHVVLPQDLVPESELEPPNPEDDYDQEEPASEAGEEDGNA
jgi:hypothetical protein